MTASKTVVLIDDDPDDHEIFGMALQEAAPAVSVIYFDSAKDALLKMAEGTLAIDYIFLDLNMPGMSGIQFLESIKKEHRIAHVPVIVYSTSILPQHRQQIEDLGAFDSIVKPFSHQELIRILRNILS